MIYRTIYVGLAMTLALLLVGVCLSATNKALSQDEDNPKFGPVLFFGCKVVKSAVEDPFFPNEPDVPTTTSLWATPP